MLRCSMAFLATASGGVAGLGVQLLILGVNRKGSDEGVRVERLRVDLYKLNFQID